LGLPVPRPTQLVHRFIYKQSCKLHLSTLGKRCVLQKQYVDCKIADALLKKGTKQHPDDWDASRKDWTHMVLQLPHTEGGFGVSFNCVTKDAAFYTTTSRFVT
jgi:hypothetical protein